LPTTFPNPLSASSARPGAAGPLPVVVTGVTAYPTSAASARVRVADFAPFLGEHGVDLRHMPMLTAEEYELLSSAANPLRRATVLAKSVARAATMRRPGLLMVQRLMLLAPIPALDPPRALDVYDFDDALLVGSAASASRRLQWVKQEARRATTCMRRARVVVASNATLASQARDHAARVEIVPSCVDPTSQTLRQHDDCEELTIGWIGSRTTAPYLMPLLPVVARLNGRGIRAKLVVVGADTGVHAEWIEHRPWSLATQEAEIAKFDVGVMPLPDTAWTRGKAGYKLLQYFAAGVPAVASPVGVNASLVADERGIAATTEVDWEHALIELLRDAKQRQERGGSARRFVEDHYSYQRWAPELAALFHSLSD
jgi:Glycosyl transferases group 1